MVIDLYQEQETELIFSYEPVWEMFFSMHVLAAPAHHLERSGFARRVAKRHEELVQQIQALAELTDNWNIVIDSRDWSGLRQMEIPDAIRWLSRRNLYQWNQMTDYYSGSFTRPEKEMVLAVIRRYYEEFYQREEMLLRPFLVRLIQEEAVKCRAAGIWKWCSGLHPRLIVEKDRLQYRKQREFHYPKKEIHHVYATVSTFLSPHLWMYGHDGEIELVKSVRVEQKEGEIPADYLLIFKALGDRTRMKLIRELNGRPEHTKELAQRLQITEAAVSKQLKILLEAKVVKKYRSGNFVKYELNHSCIDYIPYYFCELML